MQTNISNTHFGNCLITLMLISFSFVFFIPDNVSIKNPSGIPDFFIPFSKPCRENLSCTPSFRSYFLLMTAVSMTLSFYMLKKTKPKEFKSARKSITTAASLAACVSLFFWFFFKIELSTSSSGFSSNSASIVKMILTEKLALAILGAPIFFSLSIVFLGILLEIRSISFEFCRCFG